MTADPTTPSTLLGTTLSVALTVKNIEESLHWYRDLLGCTVDRSFEREGRIFAVSLRAGSEVRILITQDDGSKGPDRVKGDGFSMRITTAQDIDELAAAIRERGGALESEPVATPWGPRMFRLRDPDGFLYTITS